MLKKQSNSFLDSPLLVVLIMSACAMVGFLAYSAYHHVVEQRASNQRARSALARPEVRAVPAPVRQQPALRSQARPTQTPAPARVKTIALSKCVLKDGSTMFSDAPCPADSKNEWTRHVVPEKDSPATRPRIVSRGSPQPMFESYPTYRGPTESDLKRERCERVRQQIRAEQDAIGLNRTLRHLQQWGRREKEACPF